jgi:hypothetical protein
MFDGTETLNDGYTAFRRTNHDSLNVIIQDMDTTPLRGMWVTASVRCKGDGIFSIGDFSAVFSSQSMTTFARTAFIDSDYAEDFIRFSIWYNSEPGVDVEWAKLEYGRIATPFYPEDPALALVRCQRFFEKSYQQSVAPGTASASTFGYRVESTFAGLWQTVVFFKVTKRTSPTVTLYGLDGTPNVVTLNETQNISVDGISKTDSNFLLWINRSWVAGDDIAFHWTADASI